MSDRIEVKEFVLEFSDGGHIAGTGWMRIAQEEAKAPDINAWKHRPGDIAELDPYVNWQIDLNDLRRVGPGFEARMPGMDLD